MCEFQRIVFEPNKKNLLMCDYTKEECTLCVLGNAKTYNEAINQRSETNA